MYFVLPSTSLVDFVVYTPGMPVVCLQIASWTNSRFGLTYHTGMKTAANSQADPKSLPWQRQRQLEKQGQNQQHFWNWCASSLGIAACTAAISLGQQGAQREEADPLIFPLYPLKIKSNAYPYSLAFCYKLKSFSNSVLPALLLRKTVEGLGSGALAYPRLSSAGKKDRRDRSCV